MSLILTGALLLTSSLSQQSWHQGQAVSYRNITLYPITAGLSNRTADVITLDEGIKQGTIVITETGSTPNLVRPRPGSGGRSRSGFSGNQGTSAGVGGSRRVQVRGQVNRQGAQVNTLWLTNTSGKTLLLIAGEMLLGGQQDRIVQKDGLVPPSKEPTDLAVFCVEHGRWTPKTTNFGGFGGGAGGAFAAPSGGRGAAVVSRNQSEVWDKVGHQLKSLGNENATGTYRENYVSTKTKPVLDEYVNALMARFPIAEASGVVVAVDGKLIWMDRFDSKRTFAKYWPKLLKSYVLDAMSQPNTPVKNPSFKEAMQYAESREGKSSFEGQDGLSKLTKVESDTSVLYELEDLKTTPAIKVHANKATKQ